MRPAVVATLVLVTSLLAVTGAQDGRQESLSSVRRLRAVTAEIAGGQARKDVDNTGGSDDDDEGDGSVNDDAGVKNAIEDKAGASEVDLAEGLRDSNSSTVRVAGSKKSGSRQNYLPANPPMDAKAIISKRLTCNKKRLPTYDWCKKCICWDGSWYCSAEWCFDWPEDSLGPDVVSATEFPYPETEEPTPQYEDPATGPEYPAPQPEYPITEPVSPPASPQSVNDAPAPARGYFPNSMSPPWNPRPGVPWPRPPRKPGRYDRRGHGHHGRYHHPPGRPRPPGRPWPTERPRTQRYPWPPGRVRPGTNCRWWKKGACVSRNRKQ